jgi:hypothetical protein
MSSVQLIGYKNLVDDADLTANGTFNASHGLDYLQRRELVLQAWSASATKIFFDFGSAQGIRVAWIAAHSSITIGDNVALELGTTSGGVDVYDGDPISAWPFTPLVGTRDGATYGIPIVLPQEYSARYATLTFPAGSRIGRVFIGPAFDPATGPTDITDGWRPPNSIMNRAVNGADWSHQRAEQRSVRLVYGDLTYAEGDLLDEITTVQSIVGEVVYIPDHTNRARSQRRGFLGTMKMLHETDYPFWVHNGVAVALDERGGAP